MKNIAKLFVLKDFSLKEAFKILDKGGDGIVLVLDEGNILYGIMTDGDFRRAILAGLSLETPISEICNSSFLHLIFPYTNSEIKGLYENPKIRHIPILKKNNEVIDLILRHEFYGLHTKIITSLVDTPVVIMAGGKGSRLDPFTRILPKPLIPIGDKTILEIIIDKFLPYGINEYYLTVNYKAIVIKSYFEELNPSYMVHFVDEVKPLGTAGSLKYLEGKFEGSFIVTNCDIIIDVDYSDLLKHHSAKNNDITVVASLKHYHIPYGICEIENGGELKRMKEKPEYSFLVNTGMYVLEPSMLSLIPKEEFFHFTHLLEKVKATGGKVGVYPISENAWMDTGEWDEYKKSADKLK